jgi:hypothetical protein
VSTVCGPEPTGPATESSVSAIELAARTIELFVPKLGSAAVAGELPVPAIELAVAAVELPASDSGTAAWGAGDDPAPWGFELSTTEVKSPGSVVALAIG